MADTFDLKTKVNRAIYALIVGQGVGSPDDTYAGEVTSESRTLPNTIIEAGESSEEEPGNFRFRAGKIIFRDDAVIEPGDPNPNSAFLAAQERVSAIITQLVLSDDNTTMDYTRRQLNTFGRALAVDPTNGANEAAAQSAANNQDMTDLTFLYWRINDFGEPKKALGATYYEREVLFECVACNSNID